MYSICIFSIVFFMNARCVSTDVMYSYGRSNVAKQLCTVFFISSFRNKLLFCIVYVFVHSVYLSCLGIFESVYCKGAFTVLLSGSPIPLLLEPGSQDEWLGVNMLDTEIGTNEYNVFEIKQRKYSGNRPQQV